MQFAVLVDLFVLVCFIVHNEGLQYDYVTCGSVLKLLNTKHNVRLHSHEVKYGSGSGQQSVTGVEDMEDHNSHWAVKGIPGEPCTRGTPIKCGSFIRLEHVDTKCNLHSHLFQSPLSNNQEVSCFGKDGEGDTGDIWEVQCDRASWRRDEEIKLKHKDTGAFLTATGHKFGRPINGQREICALTSPGAASVWKAAEGVFMKPSPAPNSSAS